jgi:hypothetical protein
MEYFVSVDRKAYHDWQIELLLESFKNNFIFDKIFVGINRTLCNRYPHMENANIHTNTYLYDDVGRKKGFAPLNEIYQLLWLLNAKKIKNTFAVIKPHMILKRTIEDIIPIIESRVFLYSSDPFFTFDAALTNCGDFYKELKNTKELYQEKWFNLGNVFIVNGIPDWFVQKVARTAEELITIQIMNNKTIWSETVRLAWVVSLIDASEDIEVYECSELSSIMNDGRNTMFIDYEHGVPPDFNKSMFTFPPPKYISFGDPIEVISKCISTPNAHTMAKVAQKILAKRKNN